MRFILLGVANQWRGTFAIVSLWVFCVYGSVLGLYGSNSLVCYSAILKVKNSTLKNRKSFHMSLEQHGRILAWVGGSGLRTRGRTAAVRLGGGWLEEG